MKNLMSRLFLFMLVVTMTIGFTTTAFATTDLDGFNQSQQQQQQQQQTGGGDSHNGSVTDYLQGYTPVTDENMASASQYASPITNALGTLTGFIIMVVAAAIFVVTALDLAYIGLPFTRNLLNPEQQAQGGMSPMSGMGMGGRGMYGGAQMSGGQQAPTGKKRWVSDEAVACVAMSSAGQQAQGGMSPMGGMAMGGMAMGGMAMGGQQAQPAETKSVIFMYLKKRMFFLVIFAIAMILLTSSIFTDCGINLAELSFKIIDKFNGIISGVQI